MKSRINEKMFILLFLKKFIKLAGNAEWFRSI